MKIILTFFFMLISFCSLALPRLLTKMSIHKIRFISNDQKFTYYQKNSGSLYLSTNYSVLKVMDGEKNSQYFLQSSSWKKKILISRNQSFFQINNIQSQSEIFIVDFGKNKPKRVAKGLSPQLHREDTWLSYYDPLNFQLIFKSITDFSQTINIAIINPITPFFVPHAIIDENKRIYYTDINSKGQSAILQRVNMELTPSSKNIIWYKSQHSGTRLELCKIKEGLIIGEFSPFDGPFSF